MREAEYIKQIVTYFKKNLPKGYTPESLKITLVRQGYSRTMVEKAFNLANEEMAAEAPLIQEKPRIIYEVEEVRPEKKKGFWKRLFRLD